MGVGIGHMPLNRTENIGLKATTFYMSHGHGERSITYGANENSVHKVLRRYLTNRCLQYIDKGSSGECL